MSDVEQVLAKQLELTQQEVIRERQMIEEQRSNINQLTTQVNNLMSLVTSRAGQALMSTPPPRLNFDRPTKPSVFDGKDVNGARTWTAELEQYYRAVKMTDEMAKVDFAAAHLRGPATGWWALNKPTDKEIEDATAQPDEYPDVICTWERFKKKFLSIYNPQPAKEAARAKLDNLKQENTVQQYVDEFTNWIIVLSDEMSDEAQIYAFRRGLKHYLREKLQFIRPKNLQEAMSETLRIEQESSKQFTNRPRYNTINNYNNRSQNYQNYIPPANKNNNYSGPKNDRSGSAPMELGNVEGITDEDGQLNMLGRLTEEDRKRCYEQRLCYRCRQPGHIRMNCPKNTQPPSIYNKKSNF